MGGVNRRATEEYGQVHLLKQERLLSACVQAVDAWQDVPRIIVESVNRSSAIEHLGERPDLDADQAEAVLAMPMGIAMNGAAPTPSQSRERPRRTRQRGAEPTVAGIPR